MTQSRAEQHIPLRARERQRPRIHFTAEDGWINDPYGVLWHRDRYHLFYQAIPGRVTWAPNCHWGHAESTDLVHWTEQPLALAPEPGEVGCWSGSVVVDGPEGPTILYTRIAGEEWGRGAVALAHGDADLQRWQRPAQGDIVIPGPPDGLPVRAFRDPYVFRHGGEWVLLMGAGLADGTAAALQYRSSDLRHWSYDGVLCSRPTDVTEPVWTGALWECPQLFPIDEDRWLLLVSVWDDDVLHHVAAAVGDYDGREFVAKSWQQLTYGPSAYAMSAFTDRDGRRCVMSWLREEPQNDPTLLVRAGAHSVPALVVLGNDELVRLEPHPAIRAAAVPSGESRERQIIDVDGPVQLELTMGPPTLVEILDGPHVACTLNVDRETRRLVATRPGRPATEVGVPSERQTVELILDADLLEIFGGVGYGALRVPSAAPNQPRLVVIRQQPTQCG